MKTRMIPTIVVFTVLVVALTGCAPQAAPPAAVPPTATTNPPTATAVPPTPTQAALAPADVVMSMAERLNAGDLDGGMAYWADDAIWYIFGLPPNGSELIRGKENIQAEFTNEITDHLNWEIDIKSVVGNEVTSQDKTWLDFTRQIGVAPIEATGQYLVENGKISTYAWTITDASWARLKVALAEVMPPELTTEPAAETPVSELTVTIADGTCSYAGPLTLQAGKVHVTVDLQDENKELYALTFFTLEPDRDFMDLMASTAAPAPPAWSNMILFKELAPNKTETDSMMVEKGPIYAVCWSQPPTMPIGNIGPFTVDPLSAFVMGMAERFNAGDLDGVMNYFTDDAMLYFFGLPPTGTEVYRGNEQIRPVWEDNIANHLALEIEILKVKDDVVTAQVKTWHDFTRELGVAPLEATEVYVIKDGKIAEDTWILSEESLARVKAVLAEVMPPEPPAEPSTETPVSELTVTIANGTCSYDGPLALPALKRIQVTMDVQDQDKEEYALALFTLDSDKDFTDLMASTVRDGPPLWANMFSFKETGPATSETYSIMVTEGPVYGVCLSKPTEQAIGAVGPFSVSAETAIAEPTAPAQDIPDSDLVVTIADGKCTLNEPLELHAGENTVTMVVEDRKYELYGFAIFNIPAGKNRYDLEKAFKAPSLPKWAEVVEEHDAMPGDLKTYEISLEAKPLYVICGATPPDAILGSYGPIEVGQ